jgi:hypothetical protein
MEPIHVNHIPTPHTSSDKYSLDDKSGLTATATNMGAVGSRVMNINFRRTYALAPCHHLFHTDCLNQWMAIKVSVKHCHRCVVSSCVNIYASIRTHVHCVKGVSHHSNEACLSCIIHTVYQTCISTALLTYYSCLPILIFFGSSVLRSRSSKCERVMI